MNTLVGYLFLGLLTLGLLAVMARVATSAAADSGEQIFINQTATEGMAEVEMGKVASDHALSSEVRQFAAQMISDHTKANEELERIASEKLLRVPKDLDAEHKAKIDILRKKTGAEFDKSYMQAQVSDHDKMQQLLAAEATNGKNADLKKFAVKILPTVREHYQMAKELEAKVGK